MPEKDEQYSSISYAILNSKIKNCTSQEDVDALYELYDSDKRTEYAESRKVYGDY